MMLIVNGISFKYKSKKILNNIELLINRNEIVCILGPNGAGKTTLLKCINKILKPYQGAVFLGQKNILDLSQNKIACNLGYVPQKPEVNKLTVFDSILLGRKPHIRYHITDKDVAIVQSIIKKMQLEPIALHYTEEVSGGELQKVSIARALVQETPIILMDEPTASLDLKNQQEILNLIKDIVEFHQVAIVMTVHDINIALRYSDSIIFLKEGTIYAQIKPRDVTPEIIEAVYGVKVDIHEFNNFHHIFPL